MDLLFFNVPGHSLRSASAEFLIVPKCYLKSCRYFAFSESLCSLALEPTGKRSKESSDYGDF